MRKKRGNKTDFIGSKIVDHTLKSDVSAEWNRMICHRFHKRRCIFQKFPMMMMMVMMLLLLLLESSGKRHSPNELLWSSDFWTGIRTLWRRFPSCRYVLGTPIFALNLLFRLRFWFGTVRFQIWRTWVWIARERKKEKKNSIIIQVYLFFGWRTERIGMREKNEKEKQWPKKKHGEKER